MDPAENAKIERRSIRKNLILISLGFTMLFTAYSAMTSIQSSVNTVSQSVFPSLLPPFFLFTLVGTTRGLGDDQSCCCFSDILIFDRIFKINV